MEETTKPQDTTTTPTTKPVMVPASGIKRLINFLVDLTAITVFSTLAKVIITAFGFQGFGTNPKLFLLITTISFAYYIGFELAFQKTLGKMISKSKTVDLNGNKPSFKQVILRAFLRKLPFEFVSYRAKYPIGWHDSLADTLVVDDTINYSETRDPALNTKKMPKPLFYLLAAIGIAIFILKALNIISGNIPL